MTILAIHGGAGGDGFWRGLTSLDPARIQCMHHVLQSIGEALDSGSIDALEAVTMAGELMENEPRCNAGIGSGRGQRASNPPPYSCSKLYPETRLAGYAQQ